jgi:hypothetical protein
MNYLDFIVPTVVEEESKAVSEPKKSTKSPERLARRHVENSLKVFKERISDLSTEKQAELIRERESKRLKVQKSEQPC